MFRKVALLSAVFLFSVESFSQVPDKIEEPYCKQELDKGAIAQTLAPLALFMAYHLTPRGVELPVIGTRTNTKTHVATFLMMGSEALLLATQYPSKTFTFMASFMTPIMLFGATLNINKALGRPITQNAIVKTGRVLAGVADFVLVPAYWYWQATTCEKT